MLFRLELPQPIIDKLTEATFVQLKLFEWASQTDDASLDACETWLQEQTPFGRRATNLCQWFTNPQTGQPNARQRALFNYAKTGNKDNKVEWARRIEQERERLLAGTEGSLTPLPRETRTNTLPDWQRLGKEFLILFYDQFRRPAGLPASFFSDGVEFTSQDFLKIYLETNAQALLCSFCQEMVCATLSEGHIYTDIDHYFPKDFYPHLSIHPYNLIPACHACNSWLKATRDPLEAQGGLRRNLESIWKPYRTENYPDGLSKVIVLRVGTDDNQHPMFEELRPRQGYELAAASLEILKDIYKIPKRWQERIDIIGEKLFRRIHDFLRFFYLNNPDELATVVTPYLDELIGLLDEESQQEPYALPMLWLLAHLVVDELSEGKGDMALAKELNAWFGAASQAASIRREQGEILRKALSSDAT